MRTYYQEKNLSKSKIIFVGGHGAGKSQVVRQLASQEKFDPDSVKKTIGVDFVVKQINDLSLQLWDTMGNDEKYRSLISICCRGADVLVYCVDLSKDEINEDKINEEISELKKECPDARVILVGTKSDLSQASTQEKFKQLKINVVDSRIITSAKEGTGIKELLSCLAVGDSC